MHVVVAPDAFKECLAAAEVCRAMAQGVARAVPHARIDPVPMADGGPGTVEALVGATGGRFVEAEVTGPLGEPVRARFGLLGAAETAVIEMAAASGLELVPPNSRRVLDAHTFGTGELIRAALGQGAQRILIGIGGSATNDGGAGMAEALGYRFLDADGCPIPRGGGGLARLARIDVNGRDRRLDSVRVDVACDVTNPLTGPQGASAVYGPQKGATAAMVELLDANLAHLAAIVARDLGVDMDRPPGAGAAGGLGGGLLAFARGQLRRGVELVIDAVGLRQRLVGADLCLTGEGSFDASSQFGKTAVGVAAAARAAGVPTVVLAGTVRTSAVALEPLGISACFSILRYPCSLEEAYAAAAAGLADSAEQVVRLFRAGMLRPHFPGSDGERARNTGD